MRGDRSFTLALCLSLVLHALLAGGMLEVYARRMLVRSLPPPDRGEALMGEWIDVPRDELGKPDALGYAVHESPGEKAMLAREAAQDQAFLSRDPVGPGHPLNMPSMSTLPQGGASGSRDPGQLALVPILPRPTADPAPFGLGPVSEPMPMRPDLPPPIDVPPMPENPPAVLARLVPVSPGDGGGRRSDTPGAPVPPADPAPMSESESDAFSMLGSATYRDGQLDVRAGRDFKSVRPRFSLAQQVQMLGLNQPRIVLKIHTDTTGAVTDVDVLHSTSNTSIDQTIKITIYQWWFAAPTNAGGEAVEDTFLFEITFH